MATTNSRVKTKINARVKGAKFELTICDWLKAQGYQAVTSRSESKRLDDAGVDIVTDAPFNIQAKAVERLSPGYHEILAKMPFDKVPVVFHKRNRKGVIVAMRFDDFGELLLRGGQE